MKITDTYYPWLLLIGLLGALTACTRNAGDSANPSANMAQQHDHSQHHHGDLEIAHVDDSAPIPVINLQVEPDASSGWNVHLRTEHFRFTPEAVNSSPVAGEGHAHLYVDDFKIARLYGHWYHLKKLTPGPHVVRVTLNANDHALWSHNGELMSATTRITQD